MKRKGKDAHEIESELFIRYPMLEECRSDIAKTYVALRDCYRRRGKLLVAGNGGSASDSEHIVGELMKSFLFNRKIEPEFEKRMVELYGNIGADLAGKLEGALPAIPLTSMPALTSAFSNDVDASVSFAQMLYAYGRKEDVFLGISTSGNSKNVLYAVMVAKARGIQTVGLTGKTGGKLKEICDLAICVPETETYKIQELHLPVYHTLCAMLEADFFDER